MTMTVNDLCGKKQCQLLKYHIFNTTVTVCMFPKWTQLEWWHAVCDFAIILVSCQLRRGLRYRRGSKVPRTLSLSPCASPKINSEACFLLWLQMTSACVLPDSCSSQKKPIKKTNSCGPSMSGSSAPPRQAGKQKMQPSMENLSTEEMEDYTFSLQ